MASKPVQNVALLGPNSKAGPAVLSNLAKAGFTVTAFTRTPSSVTTAPKDVTIASADYTSAVILTASLSQHGPFDGIIDVLNRDQTTAHNMALDAAIAAKIPHIISSAFGIGISDPAMQSVPMFEHKARSDAYLDEKVRAGLITFTAINTAIFMDWALKLNLIVNLRGGKAILYDDGNIAQSWTLLDDIGKAVVGALRRKDEVLNRTCFVHTGIMSQNDLVGWTRERYPEREIETVPVKLDDMIQEGMDKWNAGDRSIVTIRTFGLIGMKRGLYSFGEKVDNEVLGVKLRNKGDMKDLAMELIA